MIKPEDLRSGIVRILNPSGKTVGTGFVVTDQLVATCAHVITLARSSPGGTVQLIYLVNQQQATAQVEADYWRDADQEDVAILRLTQPLPEEVNPLDLGTSRQLTGQPVHSFGFPETKPIEGMIATGTIDGEMRDEKGYVLLQLTSSQITNGFSGAPLLSDRTGRIVGMISARTAPDVELQEHKTKQGKEIVPVPTGRLGQTAFATPSEILWQICPDLELTDLCPYLGLSAFTEQDARFFYGRENLVEELATHLGQSPQFLAVVGASGSGKSSVVQAGLLPRLRQSPPPGFPQDMTIFSLRPSGGSTPEAALLAALSLTIPDDPHPEAVWSLIHDFFQQQSDRSLLFIDQFEELFALFPDQAAAFTQHLDDLLKSTRAMLVLTIRHDFYGALQDSALGHFLPTHQKNVQGLTQIADLRTVIEQPADQVKLRLENGLVDLLLTDLQDTKNPLPLLQFTLQELWQREHQNNQLTCAAYRNLGRVSQSISLWASDTYRQLPSDLERTLTRRLFTRLIRYGVADRPDTRQPLPLDEVVQIGSDAGMVLRSLIQRLADARLLVTDGNTVEIIHDALITEWADLRSWIAQQRPFLSWREGRLREKLRDWQGAGKAEKNLLYEADLSKAEGFLKENREDLTAEECGYIEASVGRRDKLQQAEEYRLKREVEQLEKLMTQEGKVRKAAQIILGLTFLALLATGWGWFQQRQAQAAFQAFLLGIDPPKPELLGKLHKYLKYANQLKPKDVDLALAYYRRILLASDELQRDMKRNPKKYSNLKGGDNLSQDSLQEQAKQSIILIIVEYRLPKLREMLKAGQFGRRKTQGELIKDRLKENFNFNLSNDELYDYLNLEDNFTEGALRYTYSVLMGDLGLGADLNENGMLDKKEVNRIPCVLLEEIEELWKKETNNRCGWYGEDFDVASNCRELSEWTLTTSIFEPPYDIILERFEQCGIRK